ncbi:MAG: Pyrroline-5-carboxylate reductase [uncultured bacterium]|nr:MAG: Pyrroline-5-carboxylate reductase [uncultured bacterium]
MTSSTIAIIGAGNMGSSLIGGLIQHGFESDNIIATDPSKEKLEHLVDTFQVKTTTDNADAVKIADVVIFAIKPQLFAKVAVPLAKDIQHKKPLIISIAAGIRVDSIQTWLGGNVAIVRAMPNTPALIGCGATAIFANHYVSSSQKKLAQSILESVGIVVTIDDESQIDAVTALSGSGPAYFFLVMEAMQQAAVEMGLSADIAHQLTLQTSLGAARMAIEKHDSLQQLRKNVTSPGGTTEKALFILEENNLRGIFKKALLAAKSRSEELAKLLGDH